MDATAAPSRAFRLIGLGEIAKKAGVGERTAHELAKQPWFAQSVDLGRAKIRRWVEHEVDDALANRPRIKTPPEPAHLRRGKVEAQKARGAAA